MVDFASKWGISADEPLILFLSRLIPRKGADILIEAFAQRCPDSGRLVIAGPEGEPGYRAQLEKCAQDSGVAARVIFTGPLYTTKKRSRSLADADSSLSHRATKISQMLLRRPWPAAVPVIITPLLRYPVAGRWPRWFGGQPRRRNRWPPRSNRCSTISLFTRA